VVGIGVREVGVEDVFVPALGDVLPVFLQNTNWRVADAAHARPGDAEAGFVAGDDLSVTGMDEKAQTHELAVDEFEPRIEFQSTRALGLKVGAFAGLQALGGLNYRAQAMRGDVIGCHAVKLAFGSLAGGFDEAEFLAGLEVGAVGGEAEEAVADEVAGGVELHFPVFYTIAISSGVRP